MPNDGVVARIHKAIRENRYQITDHALEEAVFIGLLVFDIVKVLLTRVLYTIYTGDQRGTRYIMRGRIETLEIEVVCRFRDDNRLLIIITVYVVD